MAIKNSVLRRVLQENNFEFELELEPMIISSEIGVWQHPFLDKIAEIYSSNESFVELTLMDSEGNNLDICGRFYDFEDYKKLKRILEREKISGEIDQIRSEESLESLAKMIIALVINFVEEVWFPYGLDKPAFSTVEYAQELKQLFNFEDTVFCTEIRPNVTLKSE